MPEPASRTCRSPLPLVSVLLAVRNEAPHLPRCLEALAAQTWPAERMEVIVADGCSEDGSAEVARTYAHRLNLRVVENPARITPAGFNRALAAARGSVVIILGGRAEVAPDFIDRSVAALDTTAADAAGGVVESLPLAGVDGPTARAVALALRSPFGVGGARYRYAVSGGWVDTVNYGTYRREVFTRIGGFDETMTWVEDDEFNYRLRAAGGRLWLDPAIRVRYYARPTLGALWRQQFRWGLNKPKVARRHPAQMRPRHAAPALFVGSILFGSIAAPAIRPARWLLGSVLGTYALAAIGASCALLARERCGAETFSQRSRLDENHSPASHNANVHPAPAPSNAFVAAVPPPAPIYRDGRPAPASMARHLTGQGPALSPTPTPPGNVQLDEHPGNGHGRRFFQGLRVRNSRKLTSTGLATLVCLPVAFATMHVAYGGGMLLGLARMAASGLRRGKRPRSPARQQPHE